MDIVKEEVSLEEDEEEKLCGVEATQCNED
jgi:hypothetical protein